jgi:hypothetical protein
VISAKMVEISAKFQSNSLAKKKAQESSKNPQKKPKTAQINSQNTIKRPKISKNCDKPP